MTELTIRHAEVADADAIARLLDQLGYPTEDAEVPERLNRLRANHRAVVLLADVATRSSASQRFIS